jgi:hypothetical protein
MEYTEHNYFAMLALLLNYPVKNDQTYSAVTVLYRWSKE